MNRFGHYQCLLFCSQETSFTCDISYISFAGLLDVYERFVCYSASLPHVFLPWQVFPNGHFSLLYVYVYMVTVYLYKQHRIFIEFQC